MMILTIVNLPRMKMIMCEHVIGEDSQLIQVSVS